MEIMMDTPVDVGGFQMDITGTELGDASGGLAADAGFTVSTGGTTMLGFSFTGSVIPAGSNGVLTNLSYINPISQLCITDVVLSDPDAIELNVDFIGDCIEY